MNKLSDLEMTRLCAEAMGLRVATKKSWDRYIVDECWCHLDDLKDGAMMRYDPLHDDAQCFALVKRLWLEIDPPLRDNRAKYKLWAVSYNRQYGKMEQHPNLNRAICECVARMWAAKVKP